MEPQQDFTPIKLSTNDTGGDNVPGSSIATQKAPAESEGNREDHPLVATAAAVTTPSVFQPTIPHHAPVTVAATSPNSKEPSLDCPHPKDILFPVHSYQLWAGNVRFVRLIKNKREDFEKAATRAIQATMAIKIMEAVVKDGGRFLTSVEVPDNEHAMIVCTTRWRRLSKREILTEIIRFLKGRDVESMRGIKKLRRDARRKVSLDRRRVLHKELINRQKLPRHEDTEEYQNEPKGPFEGPLMTLYYVPPFTTQNAQDESEEEEQESVGVSDESTEVEEERSKKPKPSARKILPKKKPTVAKKKRVVKKPPSNAGNPNSGHFARIKSTKSREAAENEGILDLPKGVTVRPSGKWQAQTYFAGQSRYIGVYENSVLASKAYEVVQEFLSEYRSKNKIPKDTPKEELAAIFSQARGAAERAVASLKGNASGLKKSLLA